MNKEERRNSVEAFKKRNNVDEYEESYSRIENRNEFKSSKASNSIISSSKTSYNKNSNNKTNDNKTNDIKINSKKPYNSKPYNKTPNYNVTKSNTTSSNKPTSYMFSQLKEKNVLPDILNVSLGIGIVLLIVFLVFDPTNKYLLSGALCLGGLVNLLNGYRKRNDKSKTISFVLTILGMVSIMVGVMIIKKNL